MTGILEVFNVLLYLGVVVAEGNVVLIMYGICIYFFF